MARKIISLNGSIIPGSTSNPLTIYTCPTGKVAQVTIEYIGALTSTGQGQAISIGRNTMLLYSQSANPVSGQTNPTLPVSIQPNYPENVIPFSYNTNTTDKVVFLPRQTTIGEGQTIGLYGTTNSITYQLLVIEEDQV